MSLALALALAPSEGRAAGVPAPPLRARRSFDFSPPRPGETLPNPAVGLGTPPRLSEFAPVGTGGGAGADADAGTARTMAAPAGAASVQSPPTAQPAPAAAPPPEPALAEDITPFQASLGIRISRLGIDGFLGPDGLGSAPTTVGEAAELERARRDLAVSLSSWNALYRPPARMVDAPVDAEISPGRVVVRDAPARMVGGRGARP